MVQLEEGKSLYEVLGVEKDAPQADIRKAYLKLAVQLHPDKNPDDPHANDRFQTLQKVYGILSDPEKRKIYDQTGSIEDSEELNSDAFKDLYEYYRNMYAPVTEEIITDFFNEYRGSEEEKQEVLKYYEQYNGDMNKVFDWVMCSDPDKDSHRFKDIIEAAIKKKDVEEFAKFTKWAKKVASKPAPKDPLAVTSGPSGKGKGKRKAKKDDDMALVEQIRNKRNAGANFLAQLESKYAGGGDKDFPLGDEPTEEEFLAARARLEKKTGETGKSKKKK